MPVHVGVAPLFVGTALNRNVWWQAGHSLLVVSAENNLGKLGARFKFYLPIHRFVGRQQENNWMVLRSYEDSNLAVFMSMTLINTQHIQTG